jgi:diguanylate cyclase (GGDEF)-like protein
MDPRPRHRFRAGWQIAAIASGAFGAGPAWASAAPLAASLLWLALGVALGLAIAMAASWRVLRERVMPRTSWQPFALVVVLVLVPGAWLARHWPLPGLALALAVGAWGLWLMDRQARRMLHLLEERDHAHAAARQAKRDSERDALTGVLNRGAWRARLEQQVADARAADPPKPVSVLFFDIDLFKLINDSLGHGVGDDCLKAVAGTVASELRGGDVQGRMGGEEFAVSLPGARRVHAIAVAERIRMAVQQHCRVVGEEVVEITVSIGAAEYLGEHEPLDALVDRADRAMYTAKDSGRNMVVADAAVPAPTQG